MNTPNNKIKRDSQEKIERTFVQLIQTKEINQVSVTEICKGANVNRSTFYANYLDIYDLADKIRVRLEKEVDSLYQEEREMGYNSNNFLKLFKNIKENQIFYRTFFKLNMDKEVNIGEFKYDDELAREIYGEEKLDYHIAFFMAGFNAIVKKWLYNGCKESPEEINEIIVSEYKNKNTER